MLRISARDILLVSLSAALLNVSFAVAQPTQPPTNGVLTPNFSGLNVSGNAVVGALKADNIAEKTPGSGTQFNNGIIVNGQVAGQTFGGASAQFGSLGTTLDASVGGNLKTDYITSNDPTATEVSFLKSIFTEQSLTVSDDTTTTSLFTRNINPLVDETDINVNGNLKTDSIGAVTEDGDLTLNSDVSMRFKDLDMFNGNLVVQGISNGLTGSAVGINDSLAIDQSLFVDTIYNKSINAPVRIATNYGFVVNHDATVNGTLNVDTIEANGDRTTFPGNIQVNGNASANYLRLRGESGTSLRADSDVQLYGDLDLDGSFFIEGINFLSFLKNRISVVRGTKSQSKYTYATCPSGQIAISCGTDTDSHTSSRVVESFRATTNGNESSRSCRTVWASASYNQGSVAICFDY